MLGFLKKKDFENTIFFKSNFYYKIKFTIMLLSYKAQSNENIL